MPLNCEFAVWLMALEGHHSVNNSTVFDVVQRSLPLILIPVWVLLDLVCCVSAYLWLLSSQVS